MGTNIENKICQNCKNSFLIEREDFDFYAKIKVPAPTFCPECRTVRRLNWRNELSFFKRKCSAPGHDETIISIYPPEENVNATCLKYWWGDEWEGTEFGMDYNFSKSFFEQWSELYRRVPLQTLSNSKSVNSDYCNIAEESKDSYMSSASWRIDRTLYSNRITELIDCVDNYILFKSEFCYEDINSADCYKVLYSNYSKNCVDSYFLYDCHGCTNCFGCTNLRNKSYCMWNVQLSKEEYNKRLAEINLGSYEVVQDLKKKFDQMYENAIHRYSKQINSVNCSGDNIERAKNVKISFDIRNDVEDCKYCHWALYMKDAYDCGPGVGDAEMLYECFDTGIGNFRNLFTTVVYSCNETEYSFNCYGCSNLFGCIGLRSKKYCILNKQYSKEEYEEILPKIKEQMMNVPYIDEQGKTFKYGEFFPAELSPFSCNQTVAQDYFPINDETAEKFGYKWAQKENSNYEVTLESENLPDDIKDVDESIMDEIISCEHAGNCDHNCPGAFKIVQMEYDFYKRMNIPLPHLCFKCRHKTRLAKRNPMKLWHRNCMNENCQNEFETSFAPDRKEKVFCESCYNREVM